MPSWNKIGRLASISVTAMFALCIATAWCQQSNTDANDGSPSTKAQSQSTEHPAGQNRNSSGSKSAPPSAGSNQSGSNAFPVEQSEAAAKTQAERQAQQNSPPPAPKAATSSSRTNPSSSSKDNPFPEAQSQAAAKKAEPESSQTTGSSQVGSSAPASGYSSSNAHLPPPELGQGKLSPHEKADTFTRDQTQDGRIGNDLQVADLYMKNGNYHGALLRYQDALQYDPQNDTALYGVANSMCKQNLTAEAMARFKSYAKSNPQGQYAVKAEHMLAHPNKCMHNF